MCAPGVLANDSGDSLTAILDAGPTHGKVNPMGTRKVLSLKFASPKIPLKARR